MPLLVLDRYELWSELASGGMATVFLGRLCGERGFARPVAIKRLHSHIARKPEFVAAFLDEARLAARIRHPNVVSTLDVLDRQGEIFVVMDYVHGESLGRIAANVQADGKKIPSSIVGAIVSGVLQGLHAAHEAKDERGTPLSIVHRDVSPQNVIVGADGIARVVDFGVAKAEGRLQESSGAAVKGKAAYMAPEQIHGEADRRTDIFAATILLWEMLMGRRLFLGHSTAETLANVLASRVPTPRSIDPSISEALEEVVMAGLDPIPERRFATAREMDQALKRCLPIASTFDVAEWLEATARDVLAERTGMVAAMETSSTVGVGAARRPLDTLVASDATLLMPPQPSFPTGRARRRNALVLGLAAMLLAVTAAAGITVRARKKPDSQVMAAPLEDEPAGAEAAAVSSVAAPPPTTTTTANGSSVATSAAPRAGASPARPRPKTASKDCDPPYWIDAKGKHFKEQCPL